MPALALDGTELHYEDDGRGREFLLVHGMGLDARMWDDQVDALRDVARIIRPDLRGFGRSPRSSDVAYAHVDDLVALLDALRIEEVDLVALSMGGMIALELVLSAPERVRTLTLLDSVIDGIPFDPEIAEVFPQLRAALGAGGMPAAREVWLDSAFFVPARRNQAVAARLSAMTQAYGGLDWSDDDPHRARPPVLERIDQVTAPTTVVVGQLDVPSFREMAQVMANAIPGARLITVPDAGHMVNMEAPETINALLLDIVRAP